MDSVRHYRDQIDDPDLKKQVMGFIGQEAMHTREHVEYNDLLQAAGLPAHKLDKRLWAILNFGRKVLPPSLQLAQTVALEHYTAMLADLLLAETGSRIEGSVDGYKQMWLWHALEETEHKSVSYDVWNTVIKPGPKRYLMRTGTMLATTVLFWLIVFDYHLADAPPQAPHRQIQRLVEAVQVSLRSASRRVPEHRDGMAAFLQARFSSVGSQQPPASRTHRRPDLADRRH
jgi:predicted metal-dependent hydrolase